MNFDGHSIPIFSVIKATIRQNGHYSSSILQRMTCSFQWGIAVSLLMSVYLFVCLIHYRAHFHSRLILFRITISIAWNGKTESLGRSLAKVPVDLTNLQPPAKQKFVQIELRRPYSQYIHLFVQLCSQHDFKQRQVSITLSTFDKLIV